MQIIDGLLKDRRLEPPEVMVANTLLVPWLKGKSEDLSIGDIASACNLSSESVVEALRKLSQIGYIRCADDIGSIDEFTVQRVEMVMYGAPNLFNQPKPEEPKRITTGHDTLKVYGAEYLATAEPNETGFTLLISRKSDDKTVVDLEFDSRDEAWSWADDWATKPVRLPLPDSPGRWIRYHLAEVDPITGEKRDEKSDIVMVKEEEGVLLGMMEGTEEPWHPISEFAEGEYALIPEPQYEWLDAPDDIGQWIRMGAEGEERMEVCLLDGELCAKKIGTENMDVPVTELGGKWRKDDTVEAVEQELSEAEKDAFDEEGDGIPASAESFAAPAFFEVLITKDGKEFPIRVDYTTHFLKKGDPMDRFQFSAFFDEFDSFEKTVASSRVPEDQAIFEFARDIAQKHLDGETEPNESS